MWGLAPSVLTKSGATISPDGGIVVGADDDEDGATDPGDVAAQAGWRVKYGSRVASPTLVTLAPGLVLYKLPADAVGNGVKDGQLIDDKRKTVGSITLGPKTALLGAPKIKKLMHDTRQGRRPYGKLTVELAAAAPEGAIALVIADAKGKPRSWGKVSGGAMSLLGYNRTRCKVLANGTIESKPGERVTAYWIDASGRKSAASGAVAIVSERPAPADED